MYVASASGGTLMCAAKQTPRLMYSMIIVDNAASVYARRIFFVAPLLKSKYNCNV